MRNRYSLLALSAIFLVGPLLADEADLLRDPTRPYYATRTVAATPGRTSSPGFRVTAIFTSDQRRIAVVNGRRVGEGDRVDGATVIEILADDIRLNVNGKVVTSRVLPNGFRQ